MSCVQERVMADRFNSVKPFLVLVVRIWDTKTNMIPIFFYRAMTHWYRRECLLEVFINHQEKKNKDIIEDTSIIRTNQNWGLLISGFPSNKGATIFSEHASEGFKFGCRGELLRLSCNLTDNCPPSILLARLASALDTHGGEGTSKINK